MKKPKKRRLIAFGCSNTYGHGLRDCAIGMGAGEQPSKFAWPQLLSNDLNRVCLNLSNPGASMREVVHKIQTTKYRKGDMVVVMFPPIPRSCLIKYEPEAEFGLGTNAPYNPNEKYGEWVIEQIFANRKPKSTALDKVWVSFFAEEAHIHLDWITLTNYVYLFLKHKNITAYYFSCGKSYHERNFMKKHDLDSINYVPIKVSGIVDISKTMQDFALDNSHPGEQSHKVFADRAFQYICQNT